MSAATPFRPVPVERDGGGRITDKTPPDPADIVAIPGFGRPSVPLHHLAAAAWRAMVDAARADGIEAPLLLGVSGYRSVDEQAWLWEGALAKYGDPEVACQWVARPGTSAHQSGRAVDLHLGNPIESEYVGRMRQSEVWHWLVANAERFGFYPYETEPWHWEYNPPAGDGPAAPAAPLPVSREERHFIAAWERFNDPAAGSTVDDLLANAQSDDPGIALGGIGLLRRWLDEREGDLAPKALAAGSSLFDVARWLGRTEGEVEARYGGPPPTASPTEPSA